MKNNWKKNKSLATLQASGAATREKVLYNQALTFYWLDKNDTKQAEHYLRKTIRLNNEAKELNNV